MGQRRGEWLELMPGKLSSPEGGDRFNAALAWLEGVLGLPPKLQRTLEAEQGIKLAGDRLRLRLFPPRISQYEPMQPKHPLKILFEDDFCLVVHKPAGVKVHPDGQSHQPTLANMVAAIYSERGEQIAPQHIHRLDEFTSGPVLYAKNVYSQLKLDAAMGRKEIGRVYVAFVQGLVSPSLRMIDAPIGKDRHHKSRRRVSPSGQRAVTHVELIEAYTDASLVRLTLETGRTHQIRVHMSHAGHPLIGDALYGGSTKHLSYQALHGESLSFAHPLTGENLSVSDPWPLGWSTLQKQLQS
ncbi:RluA family pseudouridine synthase [Paenibacillus bouchesdurhonensis]|uniref:RluA family pseudouridine synthase n=1 Tax=Paenibacillus bouchesdurhonensis TaxID=1870990 RepID=UPI001F32532E|nr:RluA family pseudouridine synthase [Paenibacillus bouchesdurhonensis]